MSTFLEKGRSFEITFGKSVFAYSSLDANISRKNTKFWVHFDKIVFCSHSLKYEYFEERDISFEITLKNRLISTSSQISTFWGKLRYFEITLNLLRSHLLSYHHFEERNVFWDHNEQIILFPYLLKYQPISRKITLFWDHFEKIGFCSHLLKYQYIKKMYVFLRSLWKKSSYSHIFLNNNILRKITLFWYHFEKIVYCTDLLTISNKITLVWDRFATTIFCSHLLKCQYFEERYVILKWLSIKSFYSRMSLNINISKKITSFWDHLKKTGFAHIP